MIDRLRSFAEKHHLGDEARRDLVDLVAEVVPRTPTRRVETETNVQTAGLGQRSTPPHDRYEDNGRIAVGGFSEVREVLDKHVNRKVARKVQLPSRSSEEDCMSFRQEVMITARLQHPGVVPVYDWGELEDGRVWFTMKRVRGDTIGKRIAALHELHGSDLVRALRRLLDDFRRLCEPVAYAHDLRIIHRDITPQNLMIGELGEVHVMDWGLARDLTGCIQSKQALPAGSRPTSFDPSETSVRTRVAGTPYYMPPEQARGEIAQMGPPSDVYALGAVLYEILSGHPPYASGTGALEGPERIVERVRNGPPPRIDEVARKEIPKALLPLCQKAMERDPRDRYPDAGALMEALRDWLDGSDRQARARRIVEAANHAHRPEIAHKREEANRLKAEARAILDKLQSFDRAQDKAEGWRLADQAEELEQQALREEIHWTQKLRSALNEAPELEEAHAELADHYAGRLLQAEAAHERPAATSYAALVADHAAKLPIHARSRYDKLLRGDGRLTLVTIPDGARAVIKPYEALNRYLTPIDTNARIETTPIHRLELPRGSYLIVLTAPGYCEARYPVLIGRDEHWDGIRPGETHPRPIRLPRAGELGPNDIYVPAGWFIAGGDPRAGESLPRKRIWVDDFVIRKHPVTNSEYVEFLNALTAEGRLGEAYRYCPRLAPGATMSGAAPLAYAFDEGAARYSLKDPEAEHALPVAFIDWHAAMAYAKFEARRTGEPWRLPSELEWEKAARGVDGRFMPWGDQVEPTWACVSGSHPARKHRMPVHEYPTDVSPYGVRGMAGNVRDWCIEPWNLNGPFLKDHILIPQPAANDDDAMRPMRGGAWISVDDLCRLSVRYAERPTTRHGVLGFRLVRPLPPLCQRDYELRP